MLSVSIRLAMAARDSTSAEALARLGSRAIVPPRHGPRPQRCSPRSPCSRSSTTRSAALLAERVEVVKFADGTVIFNVGDPGDSMYGRDEGRGRALREDEDRRARCSSRPAPGDFFGEISLLDEGPRNATATLQDRGERDRGRSRRSRRALPPQARRGDDSARRDRTAPAHERDASSATRRRATRTRRSRTSARRS